MADTIDRQAAIDAINHVCDRDCEYPKEVRADMCVACPLGSAYNAIQDMPSTQPEQDMVDDLKSFIEREKDKENRTLADWVVQWILESIIDGKCKITGSATDHSKKKMYVEFSFYQEEQDGVY